MCLMWWSGRGPSAISCSCIKSKKKQKKHRTKPNRKPNHGKPKPLVLLQGQWAKKKVHINNNTGKKARTLRAVDYGQRNMESGQRTADFKAQLSMLINCSGCGSGIRTKKDTRTARQSKPRLSTSLSLCVVLFPWPLTLTFQCKWWWKAKDSNTKKQARTMATVKGNQAGQ